MTDTGNAGWWSRMLPRVPEHVTPDFYRATGKLRVLAVVALALTNVVGTATAELPGIDLDRFWRFQAWILGIGAIDALLSLWIWKGRLGAVGLARLTMVCGVLDAGCQLLAVYALGSVNSHMITMPVVVIMFYRLAFPWRTAVLVFGFTLLAHWTIVALELHGVLPPQPVAAGPVDIVYRVRDAQTGAMTLITTAYVLAFVLGHWAVLRVRHRERAVTILREALYGGAAGKTGRHSGRVLRDTYHVGPLLASGGMGEVYRGFHRRTGRAIAIKLLHPHLVDDPDVLHRFQREAEIAGKLGSPHIVQVIDVDQDDGQPFLVLELLEGEDLGRRLEAGALPAEVVVEIVAQVASGLHEARQAGVVHRDLKPENIFLVDQAGVPPGARSPVVAKILDFGISKIQGSATRITDEVALLGTPSYMSPEQAEGRGGEIDHRCDVFALGAIAYHAITGRRPFTGPSIPAVLRAICDREPPAPSSVRAGVPDAVDAVLRIAMAKRVDERYDDVRAFARDLRVACGAAPLDDAVVRRAQLVTRAASAAGGDEADRVGGAPTIDVELGRAQTLVGAATGPDAREDKA